MDIILLIKPQEPVKYPVSVPSPGSRALPGLSKEEGDHPTEVTRTGRLVKLGKKPLDLRQGNRCASIGAPGCWWEVDYWPKPRR